MIFLEIMLISFGVAMIVGIIGGCVYGVAVSIPPVLKAIAEAKESIERFKGKKGGCK